MRAFIFDLDGVVVNTAKYHYQAWRKLAGELGFIFDRSQNERLKGVSRMESLRIVLEAGNIVGLPEEEKAELADRKNRYYLEMISKIDESEILPGILEFIEKIRRAGYKTALGSASRSGGMILRKLHIDQEFDVIVDGNEVEKPKPDPEVFVRASRLLGVPCRECVVVEDAAAGVKAAHAGGMKCIGIGSRAVLGDADAVVDSTIELSRIELEGL